MGAAPSSAHTQDGISTCNVACRAPSFRVGKRGPCYMNKPGRQKAPMHGANSGRSPTLQQGHVNPGLDPTQWNEKNKLRRGKIGIPETASLTEVSMFSLCIVQREFNRIATCCTTGSCVCCLQAWMCDGMETLPQQGVSTRNNRKARLSSHCQCRRDFTSLHETQTSGITAHPNQQFSMLNGNGRTYMQAGETLRHHSTSKPKPAISYIHARRHKHTCEKNVSEPVAQQHNCKIAVRLFKQAVRDCFGNVMKTRGR